ncbi:MAG: hypothetical protein ACI4JB_00990 [Porcipelethomonas sp.]
MSRGPKPKYDKESILAVIAEYFYTHNDEELSSFSLNTIYEDIQYYASQSLTYNKVAFPKYAQMRKILIAELSNNGLYEKGERLTTNVASRIIKLYDYYTDEEYIEKNISENFTFEFFSDPVISCIAKLPPVEAIDILASGLSNAENKSVSWGRINIIHHLCQKIKQKSPEIILAVIPQYNRMMYLKSNGKISDHVDNINPLPDTLCLFVKDTPEGRKFIEEQKLHVIP